MPLLILQVLLTLAAASVVVTVTGTELFPLILSSNVLYNPHSSPNKAISRCREPSSNNETDNVGKTGKKKPQPFFHYISFPRWGKAFSFGFSYWRQTICYLFYSRSCGCRFKFFIDGIRILDGFLYGISLLLSNTFCKLRTAWISVIPIPRNIFFWYQFKLKNVSAISFFMSYFS